MWCQMGNNCEVTFLVLRGGGGGGGGMTNVLTTMGEVVAIGY